jgi:hypothetical protein
VADVCSGPSPGTEIPHASSTASSQAVSGTWHHSAAPGQCTFACDGTRSWDGSACRAACTVPNAETLSGQTYVPEAAGTAIVHGASLASSGAASFGSSPANGTLSAAFAYSCSDGTLSSPASAGSGSCADAAHYSWNGQRDATASCAAETRAFACAAKPATGTEWNTASGYVQTWDGTGWSPADSATVHDETPDAASCRYKCAAGRGWDAGTSSCLPSVPGACGSADGVPAVSAPSSGLCSAGTAGTASTTGTGHLWACSGLYG